MNMLVDAAGVAHFDPLCDVATFPGQVMDPIPADRLAEHGLTVCADCEPTSVLDVSAHSASDAGRIWGEAVREGRATESQAGDAWLRFADPSHAAGVAFQRAYDEATR